MSRKDNIAKVSVGDIVRVVFDDHSEGNQHIVFEVFGRIMAKNRRSIIVASWKYDGSNEIDDNSVQYTLLTAAIISMHRLLPEPIEPHAKKTRKPKTKPTIDDCKTQSTTEGLGDSGRNSGTQESEVVPS